MVSMKKKMAILLKIKQMAKRRRQKFVRIQKAHPTTDFVAVAYNGDQALLHLASSLETVVRQVVKQAHKILSKSN